MNEIPLNASKALRQYLENLQRAGVTSIPRVNWSDFERIENVGNSSAAGPVPVQASVHEAPTNVPVTSNDASVAGPPSAEPLDLPSIAGNASNAPPRTVVANVDSGEKTSALDILNQQVTQCTLCSELASSRRQTVFGVGDPNARLCFFGEAPGADEDLQGEPFVGKAGQLLDKIIEACTLKREDVYICNVLRCRPPGNRNPTPDEAENCRPFFERQLEIVDPEFIVCLGAVAATTLLGTKSPIGRLRGQFHTYKNAKVIATYHPAYLLRNPSAKKHVWDDMKMLMKAMGIALPR